MKKAININKEEAGKIQQLPPKTALISMNEEDIGLYPLQVSGDNVLRMRFADIRGVHSVQHKGQWYRPMSLDEAHKIMNFIEARKDHDYIVHCAAGISRSSAVCMYIHLIYGHALKPDFWLISDPNPYILGTLISEYHRKISK
jgi:predicted protein tyrosine phosphatase